MAERPIESKDDLERNDSGTTLTREGRTDQQRPNPDEAMAASSDSGEEVSVLDEHIVEPDGPDGPGSELADVAIDHQADLVPDRPSTGQFGSDESESDENEDDGSGFPGPTTSGPDDDPFDLDDDGPFGGSLGDRDDQSELPGHVSTDPASLDDPFGGAAPELDPVLEETLESDDRFGTGLDVDAPDPATPEEMTGAVNIYPGDDPNSHVVERTGLDSLFQADLEVVSNETGEAVWSLEETGETEEGETIYTDEDGNEWTETRVEDIVGADVDNDIVEEAGETWDTIVEWVTSDYGPDAPTGQGPEEIDPDDPNWQAKVATKKGDIDGGEWDPNLLDDSQTQDYDGVDYGEEFIEPEALPEDALSFDPFVDDGAVDPVDYDDIGPGEGDGPLPIS